MNKITFNDVPSDDLDIVGLALRRDIDKINKIKVGISKGLAIALPAGMGIYVHKYYLGSMEEFIIVQWIKWK